MPDLKLSQPQSAMLCANSLVVGTMNDTIAVTKANGPRPSSRVSSEEEIESPRETPAVVTSLAEANTPDVKKDTLRPNLRRKSSTVDNPQTEDTKITTKVVPSIDRAASLTTRRQSIRAVDNACTSPSATASQSTAINVSGMLPLPTESKDNELRNIDEGVGKHSLENQAAGAQVESAFSKIEKSTQSGCTEAVKAESSKPELNGRLSDSMKPNKMRKSHNKVYHCKHCDEVFSFPVQVQLHMRKVHNDENSKGPTDAHPPTRRNSDNRNQYPLRRLSSRLKRRISSSTRRNEENEIPKFNSAKFSCKHCSKRFHALNHLKLHILKVHPELHKANDLKVNTRSPENRRKGKARFRKLGKKKVSQAVPEVSAKVRSLAECFTNKSTGISRAKMKPKRKGFIRYTCKHCFTQFPLLNDLKIHLHAAHPETVSKKRKMKQEVKSEMTDLNHKTHQEVLRNGHRPTRLSVDRQVKVDQLTTVAVKTDTPPPPTVDDDEPTAEQLEALDALMQAYSNDSEGIIETPESILLGLTSEKSRTCPNCLKIFKFSGSLKSHLKTCGFVKCEDNLEGEEEVDDTRETDCESNSTDSVETKKVEKMEVDDFSEEVDEKVPFYEHIDYRRCWICDLIVSRFHNLKRHLHKVHDIDMTYKEIRVKQGKLVKI